MKLLITLFMLMTPFAAFADGVSSETVVAWPIHFLSQSGHVVGGLIIAGALLSFYRQKDS